MSETGDRAEILDDGLKDFDDRAQAISALMTLYRKMQLPAWVTGAKRRLGKVREEREQAVIGNVQKALEAYLDSEPVHLVNGPDEGSFGHLASYVTRSTVSHIQKGYEHGK